MQQQFETLTNQIEKVQRTAARADPEGIQGVGLNPPPCPQFLNIL